MLACAVHAALLQDPGAKVLLVAQTNDAVDNLVCAVLESRCASQLAAGELVRVGVSDSARPELGAGLRGDPAGMHLSPAQCSLDHLAKEHPSALKLARLTAAMQALHDPIERSNAYADIQQLTTVIERDIIQNARIVASTLVGSGGARFREKPGFGLLSPRPSFSVVVLDEATQATLPASLIPLQLLDCTVTRPGAQRPGAQPPRVVFAGDHKQLAPTVISVPAREGGYAVSVFELLIEQAGCPTLLLDTQYRMHAAISDFPLRHFYKGNPTPTPTPTPNPNPNPNPDPNTLILILTPTLTPTPTPTPTLTLTLTL